jgi:two-component sensor histidine kinase
MLSLVQAIARQTASTSAGDFLGRFEDRVEALATAQDLLVSHAWRAVPLADLVRSQLAHFSNLFGDRITIEGPPVQLKPDTTQAIGMALHELATNAAKYGALSNDTGQVEIVWTVEDNAGERDRFTMGWSESGGPPVKPPKRRGFGSRIVCDMLEMSPGSSVSLDHEPTGVSWRFTCNADTIVEGNRRHVARDFPGTTADRATTKRVLVVEDEPLIASEIANVIMESGFTVVGPAGNVNKALRLMETEGCDAAILDVTLCDETSEPVAEKLTSAGLPFVVVTGYSRTQLPEVFQAAPMMSKPLRMGVLREALDHMFADAPARSGSPE